MARQEGVTRYGIQQVTDVDTLQLVADFSQKDYPDISDAASIKVDVLTIATNQRVAIEAWADLAEINSDGETSDIESMTITELKHRLKFAVAGRPPPRTSDANQTIPSNQPLNNASPNAESSSDVPDVVPVRQLSNMVIEYLNKRSRASTEAAFRAEAHREANPSELKPLGKPLAESKQSLSISAVQGGKGHGHHYETRQSKRSRTTASAGTRPWRP